MMISVVIPVFNSASSLEELYTRLKRVLSQHCDDFELIMVDDCSRDSSFSLLQSLRSRDERVKIIRLSANSGQHNATLCGFNYCRGELVVTMDDDLQHPPEEIPVLMTKAREGFDVVFGIPQQKQHSFYRNWGSSLIDKCLGLIFPQSAHIKRSSFRILNKDLIKRILSQPRTPLYMAALILLNSVNPGDVEVRHESRKYGKSNYSMVRALNMARILLIYYSSLPLKLVRLLWPCLLVVTIIVFFINTLKLWNSDTLFLITGLLLVVMAGLVGISFYLIGEYIKRLDLKSNPSELPYTISEIEL